jgi:LPS-assembly protein
MRWRGPLRRSTALVRCRRAWRLVALTVAWLLTDPTARAAEQDEPGKAPSVMTADTVVYDSPHDVVTATGDVEISTGKRRLLADQVRYDKKSGKVFAKGNVVQIEPTGDALFGDEVELTDDLRQGFVTSVGILLKDDSRIAASQGIRPGGNVIELDRAVYSPCPLCKDGPGRPLWQIKARRVIWDQDAQTVSYRDARLEMFGVPVAYTPYFRHPAPGVKRQSGFLTPTFGSNSELGLVAQIPYYFVLGPSSDFTFAPIFTQNAGVVLTGEYRQLHRNGYTQIAAGGTYAAMDQSDQSSEQGKQFRGFLKTFGGYSVSDHSQAGFDIYLSSDKTFLDRYNIGDSDVLRNRVFLDGAENRNFWSLNGYYFQGLRPFDDQDTIPVALPLAETHLVSDRFRWGSYFTADTNILALTRSEGLDTRRVSTEVGWTLPHVGSMGDVFRLDLNLRGDVYNTDGDPRTFGSSGGEDSIGRILPRLTADWSWPLADTSGTWVHTVEPMVSVNVAPTYGNTSRIPNEDSSDFEFDETNLFEPSRFPGLDRIDTGAKVAYGLRFSSLGPRAQELSGSFGQSYSLTENSFIPEDSGLNNNLSDYVGAFYVRPDPLIDLSYRFRLGKDDLRFRRSDALATFGPAFLRFNLGYINLSKQPQAQDGDSGNSSNSTGFDSREEVTFGARLQLTERIAIGGQTRRDISANQTVANQLGLIYTHPCLVVAVGFEQRLTPDAALGDETAILVRVAFKTLGSFEAGGGLFGSN